MIDLNEKMIDMSISGLGFVFHSGEVMEEIEEGYDYLQNEYWEKEKVAEHVRKGDMVGLCTGSPGRYILRIRESSPDPVTMMLYPLRVHLGIRIDNGKMYIRDLYDLLSWTRECPSNQQISLKNGYYDMKICSAVPNSGIIGDSQEIVIFLEKVKQMPELRWNGVPQFIYSE